MEKQNDNSMDLTGATKQGGWPQIPPPLPMHSNTTLSQSVPLQPELTRENPEPVSPANRSDPLDPLVDNEENPEPVSPANRSDPLDPHVDDEAKMSEISWREVGDLCKKVTVHNTVPGFAMTITAIYVGALVKFPIRSRL